MRPSVHLPIGVGTPEGRQRSSRTPLLDRGFYGPQGLSVIPAFLPAPSLWRGLDQKILGSTLQLIAPAPKARLLEALRASDLVISTGGGPFYSNRRGFPGLTFLQSAFHVRLAQALGKKVLFFPQSFGPFASSAARRVVLGLLGHPRTVGVLVRESASLEALRRAAPEPLRSRMSLCPDMALRLEPESPEAADPAVERLPKPRLALSVRDWDFPDRPRGAGRESCLLRYLQAVRAAARNFVLERSGSVVVVPHTRGPGDFEDDRIVSRRVWKWLESDLPAERRLYLDLPDAAPPSRLMDVYSSVEVVLAARTHAAVFALLSGTGAVSVHYQPKGPGILAQLGQGGFSLPMDDLDGSALKDALDRAADRTPEMKKRVAERIAALRLDIETKVGQALERALGRR